LSAGPQWPHQVSDNTFLHRHTWNQMDWEKLAHISNIYIYIYIYINIKNLTIE
jgi:hypothetical protein